MGVRVFPDGRVPRSKSSNAATRRVARGLRRQHHRYRMRRNKLMSLLVKHGLMPSDKATRKRLERSNPYKLRAKALDTRLPVHHVGRALFHLNQRRGFQSNRKTEQTKQSARDSGVIKEAAKRLDDKMKEADARTLGEFLYSLRRKGASVRSRNLNPGQGRKPQYDFYPTRQIILDEFDQIWAAQAPNHPNVMTDDARRELRKIIEYQRPLEPQPVGKCTLDPASNDEDDEGFRCPWAHPLAQRFRIWQEVRNLRVEKTGRHSRPLSKQEGDKIAQLLIEQNTVTFNKIKTLLDLRDTCFTVESERRTKLLGDQTAAKLAHKDFFGKAWRGMPLGRQIEILDQLLDDKQGDETIAKWLTRHAGTDRETAGRITSAFLPDGHCRHGLRAIKNILPRMEAGKDYHTAKTEAYGPQVSTGELSPTGRLPYYGEWLKDHLTGTGDPQDPKEKRWGRYPNPTVHIGLGQLRRVVNALIDDYGRPSQIVIEMTREFPLSGKGRADLEKDQAKNQSKNEERNKKLRELGHQRNYDNRLRLRLWEELNLQNALDRRCPFTGEVISLSRLFSDEVEVEHLIPYAISLDDSPANKVVCLRQANRVKAKQTPHKAFSQKQGWDWDSILRRADKLPKKKRWRFQPDALRKFEKQGGFLARQLNETGWLARLAKQYVSAIVSPNNAWVTPGRLTGEIRARWRLNDLLPGPSVPDVKKRTDHRHHAIDALVVALTNSSLLNRMSSAYDKQRSKIIVPKPWDSLLDDLIARLAVMTVSHKPDHGVQGRLHEDTSYGIVQQPDMENGRHLVHRPLKTFVDLTKNEIGRIRDKRLRALVLAHVRDQRALGNDLKLALRSFSERTDIPGLPNGIRRVRLLNPENPDALIEIAGRNRAAYIPGENAFIDILETPEGKWVGEAVNVFQANQDGYQPGWMSATQPPRFIMRVYKGDLVALDDECGRTILRIHWLEPSADRLRLAPHNEAGNLQNRHNDPDDPFRWRMPSYNTLKSQNAACVRVDPLGRVWRVNPTEAERALRARSRPSGDRSAS